MSIIEVVDTIHLGPHSIMKLPGQAVQTLLGRRLRNVEISHGKIYVAGSNSAFSGKVTNVPFDKLPAELVYKFTTVISKTLAGSFHAYSPVYGGERGAFCDTSASEGVLDGDTTCHIAESGFPVFEFSFKNGQLDGPLIVYDLKKSGTKVGIASFTSGQLNGPSEITSDGKIVEKQAWNNGVVLEPNQPPAPPVANIDACVDLWATAFRKEKGESDAMVSSEQMSEWEGWCRAGKKPDGS